MKPEASFTRQVLKVALQYGWRRAHFRPAMTKDGWRTAVSGDAKGFPDLLMLRANRLVVAELKVKARPTPEQKLWMQAFAQAGVEAYWWKPADWDEIHEVLGE